MSKKRHRGKHPSDDKLFSASWMKIIAEAVEDLSHLYTRGYAERSAVELVGNRYKLTVRQRQAMMRIACGEQTIKSRKKLEVSYENLKGKHVAIDGYNLLIGLEATLSGSYVFLCRDGCYRDIASVHGTYKTVEETIPALMIVGEELKAAEVASVHWYLDAPVSNSGRLAGLMRQVAADNGFDWEVDLVNNPDRTLMQLTDVVVISADSWVIDESEAWMNFMGYWMPKRK